MYIARIDCIGSYYRYINASTHTHSCQHNLERKQIPRSRERDRRVNPRASRQSSAVQAVRAVQPQTMPQSCKRGMSNEKMSNKVFKQSISNEASQARRSQTKQVSKASLRRTRQDAPLCLCTLHCTALPRLPIAAGNCDPNKHLVRSKPSRYYCDA